MALQDWNQTNENHRPISVLCPPGGRGCNKKKPRHPTSVLSSFHLEDLLEMHYHDFLPKPPPFLSYLPTHTMNTSTGPIFQVHHLGDHQDLSRSSNFQQSLCFWEVPYRSLLSVPSHCLLSVMWPSPCLVQTTVPTGLPASSHSFFNSDYTLMKWNHPLHLSLCSKPCNGL